MAGAILQPRRAVTAAAGALWATAGVPAEQRRHGGPAGGHHNRGLPGRLAAAEAILMTASGGATLRDLE